VGVGLGGSLTFSRGTRYDQKSIEAAKGTLGAANSKAGGKTNAQESLGRTINRFSTEFTWETGPLSGGAALHVAWAEAMKNTPIGKEVEAVELGGSIKGSLPAGASAGGSQVKYWGPALAALVRGIRRAVGKMQSAKLATGKESAQGARALGTASDLSTDGLQVLANVGKPFGDAAAQGWGALSPGTLSEGTKKTSEELGSGIGGKTLDKLSTIGVSLAVGYDFKEKKGSLQLSFDKDFKMELPGILNTSVSRSSRVVKMNFGPGNFSVE
jgi:hypothetical protein